MMIPGYRAPFCSGMTQDKSFYSFDAQAGRPAVLILAGTLSPEDVASTCAAFEPHAGSIARADADILVMVDAQSPHAFDFSSLRLAGMTIVICLSDFFNGCGFDHQRPGIVVIDRTQRVIAALDPAATVGFAGLAAALIGTLPTEKPSEIALPAPVLMIPNLFDAAFCRSLIDEFENSTHEPGGMASVDTLGNPIHKIDHDKKRRDDYIVQPESASYGKVVEALSTICVPEMKKAYQFDTSYMDRLVIARYDETGGYFRRHRDNVAPSVAFRQFALSVNLNTGDYEGGHLTFPEYNGHRYRPQCGAGIVFSASLLHEAMPVTRGRRYVLLTFFFNEEAQARRLAA